MKINYRFTGMLKALTAARERYNQCSEPTFDYELYWEREEFSGYGVRFTNDTVDLLYYPRDGETQTLAEVKRDCFSTENMARIFDRILMSHKDFRKELLAD